MTKRPKRQYSCEIVNLEDMVPKDHFLRVIDEYFDWNFVYEEVEKLYSKLGRKSIDPVVLIKIHILKFLFHEDSLRRTYENLKYNNLYRWFIGYNLNEEVPNHSTYSQNYKRKFCKLEKDLLQTVFDKVIELLINWNCLDMTAVYIDSTHTKASANKKKNHKETVKIEAKKYQKELDLEIALKGLQDEVLTDEKYLEEVEKIDDEDSLKKVKEKEEIKYDIPVQKISEPQVSESLNEEKYTYEPIKEDKQQTEQIQYKLPQKEEQTIQPVQNENIQEEKIEKENVEEKKTRFSPEFEEMYMKMFGTKPLEEQNKIEKEENNIDDITTPVENISIFDKFPENQKVNYKFIGIAFENYSILEINQDMYILNQRKAKERILYEVLKNNYYNEKQNSSQLLLLPDVITLSKKDMEIAKDNIEMLNKAGFIFEPFGEDTIKLTEVPEICVEMETKELFIEILQEINSVARTERKEIEEKFLQTVAKKVVENEKMDNTREETQNIIEKLLSLADPFDNSKGNPIAIKMSKYDIERKFSRK